MSLYSGSTTDNFALAQAGQSSLVSNIISTESGPGIDDYYWFDSRYGWVEVGADENGDPIYEYVKVSLYDYEVRAYQLDVLNRSSAHGSNSVAVSSSNQTNLSGGSVKSSNLAEASENGVALTIGNSISAVSEYPGTMGITVYYFSDMSHASKGATATVGGNYTFLGTGSGYDDNYASFTDVSGKSGGPGEDYSYEYNWSVGGESGLYARSVNDFSTANIIDNTYIVMTGDGDDRHSISLEAEASLGGSAYVGRNVITLEGGAQNDRLSVSLRANATTTAKAEISGNHITIAGGADNDHLSVSFVGTGVAGNTVELLGGSGDDTLITDAVGANRLTLDGGDGIDTVQTAESRLDLRGVVLTSVEHITTTNAAGTAFTVDSAATALLVRGTGTRDSVTGTSFNITPEQYAQLVTNGVEIVTDGSNTSYSTISHTLDAGVTNLVLTGTTAIDGTGNALANSLTGNAAANILDGKGGSDLMRGGANNDTY
jgi:hypothetical protein